MRVLRVLSVAMLSGLLFSGVFLIAACKREAGKVPTVNRPPRMAGPSATELSNENLQKLLADLDPIPDLGEGVIYKTPDGEVWTRYTNGLMIHDIVHTDGLPPKFGQTVQIAYRGTFPSLDPLKAKVFDKKDAENPLSFALGSKQFLRGLSMGISTMRVGSKRRIYIPADLAYGAAGHPQGDILPDQPLIFDVDLLAISGDGIDPPKSVPMADPLGPPAPGRTSATAPSTAPATKN